MDPPKRQLAPPASTWQDKGLEFEITDFGDARRVLDDESLAQFEVAPRSSAEQWKRVRRPTLPTDRALSGQGIDWLLRLPPGVRPELLVSRFPRIVNGLAEVWNEPSECLAALDKLLGGDRKGREGFPPQVRAELIALHDWVRRSRG